MSIETRRIEANGLQLAYLEAGTGPLVLLLHGFPDTAETWTHVMPRLAAAGYRAVAPFLRGYYPSSIPADADYSMKSVGKDAVELIAALGESQAVIIGHDWGASAAYAAANLAPERVRKLVTVAIPHPYVIRPTPGLFLKARHFLLLPLGRFAEWYTARNDYAYIDYLYRYWSPNWNAPAAEIERVKDGFRQPGRLRAALGYYKWLFADARDAQKQAFYRRRTQVPTLAFAGAKDGALDLSLYDRMPEAFSAGYEGVVFQEAGHFLHREAPDAFVDKVLQFLGPAS